MGCDRVWRCFAGFEESLVGCWPIVDGSLAELAGIVDVAAADVGGGECCSAAVAVE